MDYNIIEILRNNYNVELEQYDKSSYIINKMIVSLASIIGIERKTFTVSIKGVKINNIYISSTLINKEIKFELNKLINTINILNRQNLIYKMLGDPQINYLLYNNDNNIDVVMLSLSNNCLNIPDQLKIPNIIDSITLGSNITNGNIQEIILPDNIKIHMISAIGLVLDTKVSNIEHIESISCQNNSVFVRTSNQITFDRIKQYTLKLSMFKYAEKIEFLKGCDVKEVDFTGVGSTISRIKEVVLNRNTKQIILLPQNKIKIYTPLNEISIQGIDSLNILNKVPTTYMNCEIIHI